MAKVNFDKVSVFIDSEATKIRCSEKLNHSMWAISSNVNGDETMSFEEAILTLKKSFIDKPAWLEQQINNM